MPFDHMPSETPRETIRGRLIYKDTCMQVLGTPEDLQRFHAAYQNELLGDWQQTCPIEVARAAAQIEKGFLAIRSLDVTQPPEAIAFDPYALAVRAAVVFSPDFCWAGTEEQQAEMYATMYSRAPRRGLVVVSPILGRTTPEPVPTPVANPEEDPLDPLDVVVEEWTQPSTK